MDAGGVEVVLPLLVAVLRDCEQHPRDIHPDREQVQGRKFTVGEGELSLDHLEEVARNGPDYLPSSAARNTTGFLSFIRIGFDRRIKSHYSFPG